MATVPAEFDWAYDGAALRFAPSVRLRVPKSRDHMYDQIALFGLYEPQLSDLCRRAGRNGGLMIDVGANIGYFTSIFLAQNPDNRAIALEPSPRLFDILRHNLTANGFSGRTASQALAASSRSEMRTFVEPSELTGWGKFGEQAFGADAQTTQIECVPLDDLVDASTPVRFMKIDVEGAEALVLEGAKRLLSTKQVESLYVEVNKPGAEAMGLDPLASLGLLQSYGYRTRRVGRPRPIEDWIATPASSGVTPANDAAPA